MFLGHEFADKSKRFLDNACERRGFTNEISSGGWRVTSG